MTNRVIFGDCRDSMLGLIAQGVKVQMCVTSPPYFGLRSYLPEGHANKHLEIGSEVTPQEYVTHLVEVFRLVRDMLVDDGTLWLNIGDSYANDGKCGGETGGTQAYLDDANRKRVGREKKITGLKPKDLVGIPWLLAFALRADGWYLRSEIIWHKPAPMTESVQDRPTRSHEHVFLLAKSERYFYNTEAARDPLKETSRARLGQPNYDGQEGSARANGGAKTNGKMKAVGSDAGANWRDVWSIASEGTSEAHFAVMPSKLVERCIIAGSRPGDVVLDPFFGSGTVGKAAQLLNRLWIGCELNRDYEQMQRNRTSQMGMEL